MTDSDLSVSCWKLQIGGNRLFDEGPQLCAAGPFCIREIYDIYTFVSEELFVSREPFGAFVVIADEQFVESESFPVVGILVARGDGFVNVSARLNYGEPLFERDEGLSFFEVGRRVDAYDQSVSLFARPADEIQVAYMEQIECPREVSDCDFLLIFAASCYAFAAFCYTLIFHTEILTCFCQIWRRNIASFTDIVCVML